jgi:hypothetical protein
MTSIIKVDNLQNQCGANIISESANVITIGASGDTVTLAAGASQSGFGRSGSVNWDTTAKTTGFTAVSGNGYFCNTTSAAFTVTLPATPAAGDIVAIADYANTSATNNITVGRNGVNIDGEAINAKIRVNGQVYTLVYVDATEGWKTVSQTFNQIGTAEFVTATGGTITTTPCGNYKVHTFTGPGTFTVSSVGNPQGSTTVDYLVVAGGASGGKDLSAGGGAGGFRESVPSPAAWTASPLANPGGSLPVSVTAYPITVGAGGAGFPSPTCGGATGNSGTNSIFSTITSAGGGGGGGFPGGGGGNGGSGGGGTPSGVGTGNTPPVNPSQGNPGGTGGGGNPYYFGGGGGAISAGSNGVAPNTGGNGGTGATTSISGNPTSYAGGGGAGAGYPGGTFGTGGTGGGGNGVPNYNGSPGNPGTINTGGGGGGGGDDTSGGSGGSGVVVIRYKFQN